MSSCAKPHASSGKRQAKTARRGPGACALDDRSLLDLDGADVDVELEATERTIFAVFAWD